MNLDLPPLKDDEQYVILFKMPERGETERLFRYLVEAKVKGIFTNDPVIVSFGSILEASQSRRDLSYNQMPFYKTSIGQLNFFIVTIKKTNLAVARELLQRDRFIIESPKEMIDTVNLHNTRDNKLSIRDFPVAAAFYQIPVETQYVVNLEAMLRLILGDKFVINKDSAGQIIISAAGEINVSCPPLSREAMAKWWEAICPVDIREEMAAIEQKRSARSGARKRQREDHETNPETKPENSDRVAKTVRFSL